MVDYSHLTPKEVYYHQIKKRSISRITFSLLSTTVWGLIEVIVLTLLHKLQRFFPNINGYFMRFMHGRFGAVVTPFERSLEQDPNKRTWETRASWETVKCIGKNHHGTKLRKGDVIILPTQEIMNLLLRSNLRTKVSYCFCRLIQKRNGNECKINAPLETCLTLYLPQSVDLIANTTPKNELLQHQKHLYNLLKKCDEYGLVHQVVFVPSPNYTYVICNCCPCCCEVLSNYRKNKQIREFHRQQVEKLENLLELIYSDYPTKKDINKNVKKRIKKIEKKLKFHKKSLDFPIVPLEVRSVFISQTIDPNNCINCGKCADVCYFDSRYMDHNKLHFNQNNCYGCGLCVVKCPQNNIKLIKREYPILMAKPGSGITHNHPH
ncbi:MAG: ATP-binding protein [Candidatus Helarchaeota archaeon]